MGSVSTLPQIQEILINFGFVKEIFKKGNNFRKFQEIGLLWFEDAKFSICSLACTRYFYLFCQRPQSKAVKCERFF